MCKNLGIEFVASAANDHEANGAIESANRFLRNFFRRLRAVDQQSSINDILVEATYAKTSAGAKNLPYRSSCYTEPPRE